MILDGTKEKGGGTEKGQQKTDFSSCGKREGATPTGR